MSLLRPLDPAFPIERQIALNVGPVNTGEPFMLDRADEPVFLKVWEDDAAFMKRQPGFISRASPRDRRKPDLLPIMQSGNPTRRSEPRSPTRSSRPSSRPIRHRLSPPTCFKKWPCPEFALRSVAARGRHQSHHQDHPSGSRCDRDSHDRDVLALNRAQRVVCARGNRRRRQDRHPMGFSAVDPGTGGGGSLRLFVGKGRAQRFDWHEDQAHARSLRQTAFGSYSFWRCSWRRRRGSARSMRVSTRWWNL